MYPNPSLPPRQPEDDDDTSLDLQLSFFSNVAHDSVRERLRRESAWVARLRSSHLPSYRRLGRLAPPTIAEVVAKSIEYGPSLLRGGINPMDAFFSEIGARGGGVMFEQFRTRSDPSRVSRPNMGRTEERKAATAIRVAKKKAEDAMGRRLAGRLPGWWKLIAVPLVQLLSSETATRFRHGGTREVTNDLLFDIGRAIPEDVSFFGHLAATGAGAVHDATEGLLDKLPAPIRTTNRVVGLPFLGPLQDLSDMAVLTEQGAGAAAWGADQVVRGLDSLQDVSDDALKHSHLNLAFQVADAGVRAIAPVFQTESPEHYLARVRASRAASARKAVRKWKQSDDYLDYRAGQRREQAAAKAARIRVRIQRHARAVALQEQWDRTHPSGSLSPLFAGETTAQTLQRAGGVRPQTQTKLGVRAEVRANSRSMDQWNAFHHGLKDRS